MINIISLSNIEPKVCGICGRVMNKSSTPHYVHGHLQCECGKNIDECCQGETANELLD
jgi:hypothetical protein